jgi:hypothetical protein
MESWKKAAVLGSIGAAGILFMKKRYAVGVLATGVGLALLASEYPEKFEKVRRSLPDYFDRGMQVMKWLPTWGSASPMQRDEAQPKRGTKLADKARLRPQLSVR